MKKSLLILLGTIGVVFNTFSQNEFITIWKTDNNGNTNSNQVQFYLSNGDDINIYWEKTDNPSINGSETISPNGAYTISFPEVGVYRVEMLSTGPYFGFEIGNVDPNDGEKLLSIEQWGTKIFNQFSFYKCPNLTVNSSDVPDLSIINNLSNTFFECVNLSGNFSNWSFAQNTDLGFFFFGCTNFNEDLNTWDVSNVINMESMFMSCQNFNKDLSSWNTGLVTNMNSMFNECFQFNGNISNWNTENVTNMSWLLGGCQNFNQTLSSWNVSKVIDMSSMFSSCYVYNQPMNNWDVSSVTDFSGMFQQCYVFNQDISLWNMSSALNISNMFSNAFDFNQDLSSWNVSNVTAMKSTFNSARTFNSNISSWNVENVVEMDGLFRSASDFNQDLSTWNVVNNTKFNSMFRTASSFNQDLSSWNFSNGIANINDFTSYSGLSTENYDALVEKLATYDTEGVTFTANGMVYCSAANDRQKLIQEQNWIITGDQIVAPVDTAEFIISVDQNLCEDYLVLKPETVEYYPVVWSSFGNGEIQGDTIYSSADSSLYFPSEEERQNNSLIEIIGSSLLTEDYCPYVNDTLMVQLSDHATVNVGKDTSITSGTIQLEGIVSNSTSFVWTTSGNGVFDDANSLTASYTPSQEDYDEGMVKLTLTTLDGACENRSDDLLLNLNDCSVSIETEVTNNTVKFTAINTNSKVISNYLWAFGDGLVGRSAITEHTYEATGDYPVSVIALSADGHCEVSANTNITVETIEEPTYSITGTILSNGNPIDYARVGIFYISPDNRYELIIEDTLRPEDNGIFEFNNLLDFEYYIIASPEFTSTEFTNSRSTFFGDALVWNTASTIQPSVNNSNLDINLVQYEPPYFWSQSGIDQIRGNVTFTPEEAKKSGSRTIVDNPLPVQSAIVLLKDLNGNLLAYTTTDEFGDFNLTDLDAGIYTLEIQYIGTDISISQEIVVDGDSRTIDNFAFNIDQSDVSREDDPSGLFGSQVSTSNHLYPNPTIGHLYLKDQSSGLINYSVYSVQGELILSGQSDDFINLESLNSGIYLIEVNGVTEKIVKQ